MGPLVQAQVVVPPRRDPGVPLEDVGAQVEVDQLAVLLDAPRRAVVHQRCQGGDLPGHLVGGEAPEVPGIHAVAAGSVAEDRGRLDHLPPGHRAEPGVGGQQVDQVRGARPGQPDHDDRWLERHVVGLGMAGHEVLEAQPRLQQPDEPVAHDVPAQPGQPGVGLHRVDLGRQPFGQRGVPELRQPGVGTGLGEQAVERRGRPSCPAHARTATCSSPSRRGSRRSSMRTSFTGRPLSDDQTTSGVIEPLVVFMEAGSKAIAGRPSCDSMRRETGEQVSVPPMTRHQPPSLVSVKKLTLATRQAVPAGSHGQSYRF